MSTQTTTIPDVALIPASNNAQQLQNAYELNTASAVARVQAETQAKIIVAQRMPRSESQSRQELIQAVKASPRLAEKATYHYPRGKRQNPVTGEWEENIISGPSTYIAREAARVWRNIAYGTEVVRDDDGERQIRSFAWDMQTNVPVSQEQTFKKLIQRKQWVTKNGKREQETLWVKPDERDLRELTNRYASIGERNCILKVIPSHMIDEVLEVASLVTKEDAAKHPEAARQRMEDAFLSEGVTVPMLEEYLHHPLNQTTPDEIERLRSIFQALREGSAVWDDYRTPTTLPSIEQVPELPQLKELAAKLKWNDARLSNEIGRNQGEIAKLVASMQELVAKTTTTTTAASPIPGQQQTSPASTPTTQQQPKQQQQSRTARGQQQRNLGEDVKEF